MHRLLLALSLLIAVPVAADSLFLGTWVERLPADAHRPRLTMTITDAGGGKRLITYTTAEKPQKMTVLTTEQGEDAPVLIDGKPTEQTMAITIAGPRLRTTILKFQGRQTGTSRAEISSDGQVIKVDNETTTSGQVHKSTAYWDRQ